MNTGQLQVTNCDDRAAVHMARVVRFSRNTRGKDFVVGDIHGAFDLVLEAMKEARFDPQADRLFALGDLIDRGPGSPRCVQFLNQPYVHSIRGNHEAMVLDLYADGTPDPAVLQVAARYNGFEWWLDVSECDRKAILDAISALPLAIEIETARGNVGLIHADVPAGMTWGEFLVRIEEGDPDTIQTCLWGRDRLKRGDTSGVAGVGRVFCGHTPQWGGLTRLGNVYAVDTGGVFGEIGLKEDGALTMAQMMTRTEVLSAPRRMPGGLVDLRDEPVTTERAFGQYAQPCPTSLLVDGV